MLSPISDTKDMSPIPAIIPVVTLKILLLTHLVYACTKPSTNVGNIKRSVTVQLT